MSDENRPHRTELDARARELIGGAQAEIENIGGSLGQHDMRGHEAPAAPRHRHRACPRAQHHQLGALGLFQRSLDPPFGRHGRHRLRCGPFDAYSGQRRCRQGGQNRPTRITGSVCLGHTSANLRGAMTSHHRQSPNHTAAKRSPATPGNEPDIAPICRNWRHRLWISSLGMGSNRCACPVLRRLRLLGYRC